MIQPVTPLGQIEYLAQRLEARFPDAAKTLRNKITSEREAISFLKWRQRQIDKFN